MKWVNAFGLASNVCRDTHEYWKNCYCFEQLAGANEYLSICPEKPYFSSLVEHHPRDGIWI